jgi:mono/diheme cytochrome c family protein
VTLTATAGFVFSLLLWPALDNRLGTDDDTQRRAAALYDALAEEALQDAARLGQPLLLQYQCGSCHRIAGVAGASGTRGPSLRLWGRRSYIAGHLPNTQELLARWVVDPAALLPDSGMPALGVTPTDAQAMAAYLRLQR